MNRKAGGNITLGNSREPPVATFCGRMKRWSEYRGFVWRAPKRLPSRRWAITAATMSDPDEDEYDAIAPQP
jgi:hypothetical protein